MRKTCLSEFIFSLKINLKCSIVLNQHGSCHNLGGLCNELFGCKRVEYALQAICFGQFTRVNLEPLAHFPAGEQQSKFPSYSGGFGKVCLFN